MSAKRERKETRKVLSKGPNSKHRVLIVDDHAVFREGLRHILHFAKDFVVCGEAEDGVEALRLAAGVKPDLAIVDISLPGMNGIDLTKNLRARFPALRILVLSMHDETLHGERALRAGANGYIMKRENGQRLIAAVLHVLSGQTYVSENFNEFLLGRLSSPGGTSGSPVSRLSDREFQVFQFIGQGYGTRQMAEALHLSMKTIEFHRENIRAKLNLASTFELVQHAIQWTYYEKKQV